MPNMSDVIFPDVTLTPDEITQRYPQRCLPEGAQVTRFAPSPTGFLHIGGLFTAMINYRLAKKTGGVFFIRIEDTDKKREVEGGIELITKGLEDFGIIADEGFTSTGQKGGYGPYQQSQRRDIYRVFAKKLMDEGKAYPCFMTEGELEEIRAEQEKNKQNPGIYGQYAKYRGITPDEAQKLIDEGRSFVVRLRSCGDESRRIKFKDSIRGKIEMPENIQDTVILKADGIPTYHFAHVIDDHLMGTTTVIRGDEWISSVPIHLQMFYMLGFKAPNYAHVAPIMKEENGGKRKLSKRKDPEAAVSFYREAGYPMQSVSEYLMTIASSAYEDFRRANPRADVGEFNFELRKMSQSGALFDLNKLNDVSKNTISRMTADTVYDLAADWAKEYDAGLYSLLSRDEGYSKGIFAIDRDNPKPRKDIAKWSEVRDYVAFMFDELFLRPSAELLAKYDAADAKAVLAAYAGVYDQNDSKDEWFERMKTVCDTLGFARETKAYKQSPESYKGHIGDVSTIIRAAVTGRTNTPDLYYIEQLLGYERVVGRIKEFAESL
ncbi:MAG: glutamate--tRNA ligase [Clostridia bacterium]|nr:glutamate--tRNA ligase [Clostridia bacterium]